MRGERSRPLRQPVFSPRFIPACAGNAPVQCDDGGAAAVHPRMRGERRTIVAFVPSWNGSSPHARGTHDRQADRPGHSRFIPACAGNAPARLISRTCSAVHPRMRGERWDVVLRGLSLGGSSPHARGTPVVAPVDHAAGRFIPACAGNATRRPQNPIQHAVHPRMRGERAIWNRLALRLIGSSPHARGTHFQ